MAKPHRDRVEIRTTDHGRTSVELNGEPIAKSIDKVVVEMNAVGDNRVIFSISAPLVTLSVLELSSVMVYRAQLVSTLGIDRALDGLTAEAHSIEDALTGLLEKVRQLRAAP